MNIWKIIYLNCAVAKSKPEKRNPGVNENRTHDLCDTVVALYRQFKYMVFHTFTCILHHIRIYYKLKSDQLPNGLIAQHCTGMLYFAQLTDVTTIVFFLSREFVYKISALMVLKMLRHDLYSSEEPRKDKSVPDVKQRCLYPRESQKLTWGKIWHEILRLP